MPENLTEYLNMMPAGDMVELLIAIGTVCAVIFGAVFKFHKKYRKKVEKDIQKEAEWESLTTTLKTAQEDLESLKEGINKDLIKMREIVNDHLSSSGTTFDDLEKTCSDLSDALSNQEKRIMELEKQLEKINSEIDLLFNSDKTYFHTYIVDAYNKYVKSKGCIDLFTLQTVENMYNKYVEEAGSDEFLARLLKDLRNLPTTKDRNENT